MNRFKARANSSRDAFRMTVKVETLHIRQVHVEEIGKSTHAGLCPDHWANFGNLFCAVGCVNPPN